MDLTSITVIVENKSFSTTENSLLSSGFFRGMMEVETDTTKFTVPCRSKKIFKYVLCYLVDSKYPYPRKYKYELDFYDIEYDEKLLYDPYNNIIEKLDKIEDKQTKMASKLDDIKQRQKKFSNELSNIQNRETIDNNECRLCHRNKIDDSDYCDRHKCCIDDCNDARVNDTFFCDEHICKEYGCINPIKLYYSRYCTTHC